MAISYDQPAKSFQSIPHETPPIDTNFHFQTRSREAFSDRPDPAIQLGGKEQELDALAEDRTAVAGGYCHWALCFRDKSHGLPELQTDHLRRRNRTRGIRIFNQC